MDLREVRIALDQADSTVPAGQARARSRSIDDIVFSCPPGQDPSQFGDSQADVSDACANPAVMSS